MNIKSRTLALALAAAFPIASQATDGYFSHGYGMQAKGMGGAATFLPMAKDADVSLFI